MNNIYVSVLDHNFNGMPIFLARLTQRGSEIANLDDLLKLYNECVNMTPSDELMALPHTTLKRMNYLTVAIFGLSTKAVSQIRTHAKRLTFISTSTQYSTYCNYNKYVYTSDSCVDIFKQAYASAQKYYDTLIANGVNKDDASYLLPQGLSKILIVSGNLDDWEYVMNKRLCNRNSREVQYVMAKIYNAVKNTCGETYVKGMLPDCKLNKCREKKFSCKRDFNMEDINDSIS